MSRKYRILVESSPVVGEVGRHAFIVLQYVKPDGAFANLWEDENAIIYRSGPAKPLLGGEDFDKTAENWVNEVNATSVPDVYYGSTEMGNTVTHIGAFIRSSDYMKFYGMKNPNDRPDTSLTLHKVYENDGFVDAQAILDELSLRFAHDNSNYNAVAGFDESHSNSNTYAGWILQEALKEIGKQSGVHINIEKEMQIILSKLGNVPGFNNKDTIDIDMSLSMKQIKDDLILATIVRDYFSEEAKVLYELKDELDALERLNQPSSRYEGMFNDNISQISNQIEELEAELLTKVQKDIYLWTNVASVIENPSQEHDLDLSSWYEIQGGTNSNNFFDIHVNFSHGTAGSEQKSESETIQSVINDGLIASWGGTTISSSTVNEAGFWAEINAAISDGFQPGRGNVINSTASDQVKNYYWQAEGLEDSVYLNSFGYISNFSQHLEEIDPMILDLDGDGIELTAFSNHYIFFDIDNDGYLERTGWVGADDGMLVHDLNGDGIISDMTEVMSEYYGAAKGTGMIWSSAFAALASLDSNRDGVINDQDINFATDPYNDKNAIIYRSGAASPLSCL